MSVSSDLSILSDLRRQGELTAEEYAAAKQYVLTHGTLEVVDVEKTSRNGWADLQAFFHEQVVTSWKRVLTIAAVTLAGSLATGWTLRWLVENGQSVEGLGKINFLGAAGWTVILLVCCGLLVGYNMRILKVISVPLFLFLLLSPLWNDAPAKSDGPKIKVLYSRTILSSEYGEDWPFPASIFGVLRCEQMTRNDVTRSLVTVQLEHRVYGLNGAAFGWGGYKDARTQMVKHPEWGTFELGASDRMISEALANCG